MGLSTEQKQIVREIRRLHSRREPLNIPAVKRNHPELIERVYAVRPYWGWKRALEDAGLSYDKINTELLDYVDCKICGKDFGGLSYHLMGDHNMTGEDYRREFTGAEMMSEKARAGPSKPRSHKRKTYTLPLWETIWTTEYVMDRMAELHRLNYPLNSDWAGKHEVALHGKAILYFGSWDEALQRIGLDPEQIRCAEATAHLTATDVIKRLQNRQKEGLALNSRSIHSDNTPLANAIQKYFRSHDRALRAAGFDPKRVRKQRKKYSAAEIGKAVSAARRIARLKGEPHRRAWIRFKRKYFKMVMSNRVGSCMSIAKRAGIPVEQLIWKRFRNREDVIAALHERVKQGKSVQASTVVKEDLSLRTAVLKYFGSFDEVYRRFGSPSGRR